MHESNALKLTGPLAAALANGSLLTFKFAMVG